MRGMVLLLVLTWGGFAPAAEVPVDSTFTYQGRLTDGGVPAEDAYDMRFSLFDAPAGGNQAGRTRVHDGANGNPDQIAVADGLFTVGLTFGSGVFVGNALWLEIEVRTHGNGRYVTLDPRQPLTATPFALYALAGPGPGGFWGANGADVYSTNSGNVGIGTATPQTKLDVFGEDAVVRVESIGNDFGPKLVFRNRSNGDGITNGTIRFQDANDTLAEIKYRTPRFGASALTLGTAGGGISIFDNGRVGIGTSAPGAMLDVDGTITAAGMIRSEGAAGGAFSALNPSNQSASFSLGWSNDVARLRIGGGGPGSGGGLDIQRTGNESLMRILHNGNVGIGDATPTARLDVYKNESNGVAGIASINAGTGYAGYYSITNGSNNQAALYCTTDGTGPALLANTGTSGIGVQGIGGYGVYGFSENGRGVYGFSEDGRGVYGQSDSESSAGVFGLATGGAQSSGLFAQNSGIGFAAKFSGTVFISENLFVNGSKNFLIDNPLNPSQEYLFHSCVESDEMKNIYDGVAEFDADGKAEVRLPDWFDRVNADFRYQLTSIGGYAPAFIESEIENNRFTIAGGREGMKISWQVTGVRIDPAALAADYQSVRPKPAADRGSYLNPEAYGQPPSARTVNISNPTPRRTRATERTD